jgi:outer membrane protein assembly factor BamE
MIKLALSASILLMVLCIATGCVYKVNVQQGNFLTSETVDQLKEGMTRSQVRFLLGTPMVPDAFDNDRWDYLYVMQRGRLKEPERRRLTVFFTADKVVRFENEGIVPLAASQGQTRIAAKKPSLWRRIWRRGDAAPAPAATP